MRVFFICLILFVSCTKELKNDINNLNEIINSMRVEIDSLNSNLAKFELTDSQLNQIINDMEIKINNFNYLYENEIIGCWFNESFTIGNTPLFIEVNIFKGGVGALDFGGGVYQIFSWTSDGNEITLHFGDVLDTSSFGVIYNFINDSAYILYGEIFDNDRQVSLISNENGSDSFIINNWRGEEILFNRCN
tara:strand:+ start:1420 stop:1992 length:573 start_codon:yes stop_codon:yes gene_type:complete